MLFRYFESRSIEYGAYCEDGSTSRVHEKDSSIFVAIKEFDTGAWYRRLKRIWFYTYHPNAFSRGTAHNPKNTARLYRMALRERTLDMAYLSAYGLRLSRPAYLLTAQYFTDRYSGTVVTTQRPGERGEVRSAGRLSNLQQAKFQTTSESELVLGAHHIRTSERASGRLLRRSYPCSAQPYSCPILLVFSRGSTNVQSFGDGLLPHDRKEA